MTISGAGCGDDEGTTGAGSGDDVTAATIEGIWRAAGVDDGDVATSRLARRSLDTGGCADLPDGDRWYEYRSSELRTTDHEPRPLFEAAGAHLTEQGFEVERLTEPVSGELDIHARSDAATVTMIVSTNGAASMLVYTGPCARFIAAETSSVLEPLA